MTRVQHTIEIAAPPARVWQTMSDLERWPDWTPTVTLVQVLDAGPIRTGLRARLEQPGQRPFVWQVTRVIAERGFTWQMHVAGMVVRALHEIEPSQSGGSLVTLPVEATGPGSLLLGWMVARAARRNVPREAEGLKARLEQPIGG